MARMVFIVLALFVAQTISAVVEPTTTKKIADETLLQRQIQLSSLFYHVNEPIHDPELLPIVESFDLEKNVQHVGNVTALTIFLQLQERNMLVPRSLPFNVKDRVQMFEAVTIFNMLYSIKDYTTFFKTAVYLRERINEGLFVYVLSVAILHHPETQGITIPHIYEVFPSYFHNGKIMNIAQRINTHGKSFVKYYPETYLWDDNVVIRWNSTVWPYVGVEDAPISYYLNDYALNALYYYNHLSYPYWLPGTTDPLIQRGESFWFVNKQYLTRYYMERLSNGLGEIPELGLDVVQEGYASGLQYEGVQFPVRPDHFSLDQPKFIKYVERLNVLLIRIRDAIEVGYVVASSGEKISLRVPEAIDVLGKVIEGNVDSPNLNYYGSIITVWKELLGNAISSEKMYFNGELPMVMPSTLELLQTTVRDPAFYMIWKRVLNLFTLWQSYLPQYTPEEIGYPTVSIEKVEVDKLVTYFENTYLNVTNALPMDKDELKTVYDQVSVLVQRPQLNHKVFKVRVSVKSSAAKTVYVKFFLAPKYDSKGLEIPLHINTENFFQIDEFVYELPQGESVIKRESTANTFFVDQWLSSYETYTKVMKAYKGDGQFTVDMKNFFVGFPQRLMIPKGRVSGMPFHFLVYISKYEAPKVSWTKTVDFENIYGMGNAARMTNTPLGYPLDRPLYQWQIQNLTNLKIEEVQIFHKPVPEIYVPNTMYV